MSTVLSIAIAVTTLTSIFLVLRFRNVRIEGSAPMPLVTFLAVLFTSGLDVGLLMFPMVDFEIFTSEPEYVFANPLALEFGFWGFLVWGFYFLTTFYFCVVEPRLQLFEVPAIKLVNNLTIIGTCAFTGYLFLHYLPSYIEGIPEALRYALVAGTVLIAVISSTQIRFVKLLSLVSSGLFFALIAGSFIASGMGVSGFADTVGQLGDYFGQLPRYVFPINDYHAFYLFWWFAWSIMIGQFVSRFVSGFTAWQLLLLLLIVPSIPIALWFSVLYWYFANEISIAGLMSWAMMGVGILFVVNSLDSLTRLYTTNVGLTVDALGTGRYTAVNWLVLFALIMAFQFTPFKIEWVGLVVIGIYAAIYVLVVMRRTRLRSVAA
ncbi:MAG: BCCT family transporter [Pseudomonadota bacterium]|nr:BCCT family transporter [Pseudomonadota bacterium]